MQRMEGERETRVRLLLPKRVSQCQTLPRRLKASSSAPTPHGSCPSNGVKNRGHRLSGSQRRIPFLSTFPTVKWGSSFPKTELTHGELTADPLPRKTTRISAGAAGQTCGGLETPGDKLLTPITFLPHTRNTENLEQKSGSRRNVEILSRLFCRQGN